MKRGKNQKKNRKEAASWLNWVRSGVSNRVYVEKNIHGVEKKELFAHKNGKIPCPIWQHKLNVDFFKKKN